METRVELADGPWHPLPGRLAEVTPDHVLLPMLDGWRRIRLGYGGGSSNRRSAIKKASAVIGGHTSPRTWRTIYRALRYPCGFVVTERGGTAANEGLSSSDNPQAFSSPACYAR